MSAVTVELLLPLLFFAMNLNVRFAPSYILFLSTLFVVGTNPRGNAFGLLPLIVSQSLTVFISCVAMTLSALILVV